MKTRNVDLKNTPLLTNNICKSIFLEAPTKAELIKKVEEYEKLLVRALTNKYKLTYLMLAHNGTYELLPDGNYQASVVLNFTGLEKNEITSPEKTLQIVKHLTALESKKHETNSVISKPLNKKTMESHIKSLNIPINVKPGDSVDDVISMKQNQLLEQLMSKVNLKKISFLIYKKPNAFIEATYEYEEKINDISKPAEKEER